jgi:glycosyltransferase involved in cell wall biosynthesis
MSQDLVSIVMPVYNAAATVLRSIRSVLAQTHPQWELIAVDDCSRDGSWALLGESAALDPRIRPVRLARNSGVAAARNAALDAAIGRHVAFLDSDDRWHPRKLELQLACMRETGARVSYAAFDRVAEDDRILSHVLPPASVTHEDMLKSNHIGNLTGMYLREAAPDARFLAMGHEDYVFWLELVRRAGQAVCVPSDEPLASYLVRASSVSSNKLRAVGWQWRIYRDVEKLGFASALRYMSFYAWHALAKRGRI